MAPWRNPSSFFSLDETAFSPTGFSRLWLLASGTYGVGDIVTTIALLNFSPRVQEANVLLRVAVETFGGTGLVAVKLVAFGVCLAISLDAAHAGDDLLYYGPPVFLALFGTLVTIHNIRLLF